MALDKDKLVFDETAVSDSDQVGAHILGSANAKITSTTDGGKEGLDVFILNDSLAVTATNLDIRDLVFATDKVDVSGSEVSLDSATLAALESITVQNGAGAAAVNIQDGGNSITVDGTVELGATTLAALESITVVATDLDIRDLAFATDSVDVSGSSVSITGTVAVTQSTSPWVVSATDLDIRDLDAAQDNVAIDGISAGGNALVINADGSLNVNADISVVNGSDKAEDAAHASGDIGTYVLAVRQDTIASSTSADGDYASLKVNSLGQLYTISSLSSAVADDAADTENPIKVGSRAVDGLLPAISASGDKANLISDMYRRLWVNSAPNVGFNVASATVTTTAAELASSPLVGRMKIEVQNLGNQAIYIGHSNAVTSSNGYRISAGATAVFEFGEDLDLWAIAGNGSQNVRILQLA